ESRHRAVRLLLGRHRWPPVAGSPRFGMERFAEEIMRAYSRPLSLMVRARALHLLTEELNATPATMPADHRPLSYQLAEA
ncbi:MAG TPA: hypothetical protein VIJ07_23675, partial [Dermatophilaceae bacterium]